MKIVLNGRAFADQAEKRANAGPECPQIRNAVEKQRHERAAKRTSDHGTCPEAVHNGPQKPLEMS
jgi:hypothetical protein